MNDNLEYIFAQRLRSNLKSIIFGGIWCRIVGEELVVQINSHDLEFEYIEEDIYIKIFNGMTTDYLSYKVAKSFKKYVIEQATYKHFIRES